MAADPTARTIPAKTVRAFVEALGCDPTRVMEMTVDASLVVVTELYVDSGTGAAVFDGNSPLTVHRYIRIDRLEAENA